MHARTLLSLGLVCAAVAGCGSDDEQSSSSEKPAATSAPSSSGGGAASKAATDDIKDFTFTPETLTVKAGGTVTWTNKDSANHNVVFDDKSIDKIANLRKDQSGKITFDKAGSYSYVCTYHPGMKGTVTVK